MRLTPTERLAIETAAKAILPSGSRVWLFGSRTDDARRGGDIDLMVETPAESSPDEQVRARDRFTAGLYRALGERRIDVVITRAGQPDARPIVALARRDGIGLAHT